MTNPAKVARITNNQRAAAIDHAEMNVIGAAKSFLDRIDNMTTHEFERGGERVEREALRNALARLASFE